MPMYVYSDTSIKGHLLEQDTTATPHLTSLALTCVHMNFRNTDTSINRTVSGDPSGVLITDVSL